MCRRVPDGLICARLQRHQHAPPFVVDLVAEFIARGKTRKHAIKQVGARGTQIGDCLEVDSLVPSPGPARSR